MHTQFPDNPLLAPSTLPFQAPPFDRITDSDFAPAFEAAMRMHVGELETIANNQAPPTFENTLAALERSGHTLARVSAVFSLLTSANTNETLQQLLQDIAPRLAAHDDSIVLNRSLFSRIEAVHAERESLALDDESRRLVEVQHRRFVLAGARLSDEDKAALKALNEEEATLGARFVIQLLAASKDGAMAVTSVSELDGLSPEDIDLAAATALSKGLRDQWILGLTNTTQQPLLRSLRSRTTRERLFRSSRGRTSKGDAHDTSATIARLAALRAARAQLLGEPSHAAWRLRNQMAQTPERVEAFLAQLVPAALAKAQMESTEIRALFDDDVASDSGPLEGWDWQFYAERVRQAKYALAEADITPYLELDRVLRDGVFYAAECLYGMTVTKRIDLPVYHPDVEVYEILDADGAHLGLFYTDFFRRDNKNGGAWMDNLLTQSTLIGTHSIVCNVLNVDPPAPDQPALLSLDEVVTLFHEFGHALHGLCANQRYVSLSGTAVSRDFVELPSLFNEHWALDPVVFGHYARHYRTGEQIPATLVAKIRQASTFSQGYSLTEILAAATLDLRWHSLPAALPPLDIDRFERESLHDARLDVPAVPPRYDSRYFLHIWANGYDAGYYAYLWAEMLAHDVSAWFDEHGGLTRENGQRFRDCILSRGNTQEYDQMFLEFRERDPDIGPMLRYRGLETHPDPQHVEPVYTRTP